MRALEHQLETLDVRIENARGRRREIEQQQNRAGRDASRARAQRVAYEEAVGAGEREPDLKEEKRLSNAIADAERAATDDAWRARLAGADRAIEEAQRERDVFLAEEALGVVAEGYDEDVAARDRLSAAWEELAAAEEQYAARVRRAVVLARKAEDVPALPAAGDEGPATVARRVEVPAPRSLAPRREEVAA